MSTNWQIDFASRFPPRQLEANKNSKLALGTLKNESGASDLPPEGRLSKYFQIAFLFVEKKVIPFFFQMIQWIQKIQMIQRIQWISKDSDDSKDSKDSDDSKDSMGSKDPDDSKDSTD